MKDQETTNDFLTEILIIKDLYICGRMNQAICSAVTTAGNKPKQSSNWSKYEELSKSYIDDAIEELMNREEELLERFKEFGSVTTEIILDTTYQEFDNELINDMMLDFYGSKDTVAFATAYNKFALDFNTILGEFVL